MNRSAARIVLASQSPRRAELLRAAGIAFTTAAADLDETPREGEPPEVYVERLAVEKAQAVAAGHPDAFVLGADTTVVVGGRILGKPLDADDAAGMLRLLAGRSHEVLTGVALVGLAGVTSAVDRTTVWFTPMTEADIHWYVASGEPMDKAGAYGIQGLASRFVSRVEGSYTSIVGLPVELVVALLTQAVPGFRH